MICSLIAKVATSLGIAPLLLAGVIHQESAFNPYAINNKAPVWSYGLGQLTIATAKYRCGLKKEDLLDPRKNLQCAGKVLAYQLQRYNGNIDLALSAYNAGTATQKNYTYVQLVKQRMTQNKCEV